MELVLIAIIFVLSLLTAFVIIAGVKQILLIWIGGLFGLGFLFVQTTVFLWCILFITFVVTGQLMYFANIQQAVWIPYGLALLLYAKFPSVYFKSLKTSGYTIAPLVIPVLFFLGVIIASVLTNTPNVTQVLRACKSYTFLWSIFFIIAYAGIKTEDLEKIFKSMIYIAYFQLPLVLYQFFVIAPQRSNLGGRFGVSWDAIVGGFGGDPMGGGASGTMAWFLVFVSVLCIAMHRFNALSRSSLFFVLLISLLCIALAEVKVVVILLPLALSALYIPYLKKNPLLIPFGLGMGLLIGVAVLFGYSYLHGNASSGFDLDQLINDAFWYSLDPKWINYETGEMGRVASIAHWWNENGLTDLLHTLIGHGPGSSSSSLMFGAGEMARKYSFDINRSTLSIFLWDIGLIGTLAFISLILNGLVRAYRLSVNPKIKNNERAIYQAIFGGLVTIIVMVPYGKDVSEVPSLGILLMIFLGTVSHADMTYSKNLASRVSIKS